MKFTEEYNYYKQIVDDYISFEAAKIKSLSPRLVDAVNYTLLNGGKRLRPVMCLAACKLVGGQIDDCVKNLCFSVEALHTYTLIHDDLPCMDNDSVRRGRDANHIKFGEAHALLAGDALLNLSFEYALNALSLKPQIIDGVKYFYSEAGVCGIVGGQAYEFEEGGTKSQNETLNILQHKTAKLFKAAMVLGGVAGGADKELVNDLRLFGHNFGMAFQLYDDIADMCDGGFAKNFGLESALTLKNKYLTEAKAVAAKLGYTFFTSLAQALV